MLHPEQIMLQDEGVIHRVMALQPAIEEPSGILAAHCHKS